MQDATVVNVFMSVGDGDPVKVASITFDGVPSEPEFHQAFADTFKALSRAMKEASKP